MRLYTIFHLNMSYSSIDDDKRPTVIERCYWPVLDLIKGKNIPFGIEVTGSTLEIIDSIDSSWVSTFKTLLDKKRCELIGSGYTQMIGPLVPALVNRANLALGNEVYQKLLGHRADIALVNEQAFSSGIVPHFLDAGFKAIVMEWNNPARYHPEWPVWLRYLPQRAKSPDGETIPLIWNDALSFQRFQRYAHGEFELDEVLSFLQKHAETCPPDAVFPLYGNDIEIFDFRPGRYDTEESLGKLDEWSRIEKLYESLESSSEFDLILPSQTIELLDRPGAGEIIDLSSPEAPIPVKKQEKYNITRWSLTGRDDLGLNTACFRVFQALCARNDDSEPWTEEPELWRRLCQIWASDLRTHITENRWAQVRTQVRSLSRDLGILSPDGTVGKAQLSSAKASKKSVVKPQVQRRGRWLEITSPEVEIRLNCRRGLAVEGLRFPSVGEQSLVGTIPHGYFQDISLGADFYTGHTVVEIPGLRRVADLNPTEPKWSQQQGVLKIWSVIPTPLGEIWKTWRVSLEEPKVSLSIEFNWSEKPLGAIRTGIITLLPWSFARQELFFKTWNGGDQAETFSLRSCLSVLHSEPANALVTARNALGATTGKLVMGDDSQGLAITFDRSEVAAIPMILFKEQGDQWLFRVQFSLGELDETRKPLPDQGDDGLLLPSWQEGKVGFSLSLRPETS